MFKDTESIFGEDVVENSVGSKLIDVAAIAAFLIQQFELCLTLVELLMIPLKHAINKDKFNCAQCKLGEQFWPLQENAG